jgi:hypothetical protein
MKDGQMVGLDGDVYEALKDAFTPTAASAGYRPYQCGACDSYKNGCASDDPERNWNGCFVAKK